MYFVAEIGMNHDGNFDLALELIRQAKLAGADAAKFQFGWRDKPGEINQITPEIARRLQDYAAYTGIDFFASIISEAALDLARPLDPPIYKIASRTVRDNPDLCRAIIAEGKPTYISLGMWEGEAFPFGPPDNQRLFYIWCKSLYPALPADLKDLPARFGGAGFYGYSDHCLGIDACLLAISRGAKYIEKHFTLNKDSQVIRDHTLSATPEEFRRLTEHGRAIGSLVDVVGA
jgi:sialic acid synthase SpsE